MRREISGSNRAGRAGVEQVRVAVEKLSSLAQEDASLGEELGDFTKQMAATMNELDRLLRFSMCKRPVHNGRQEQQCFHFGDL